MVAYSLKVSSNEIIQAVWQHQVNKHPHTHINAENQVFLGRNFWLEKEKVSFQIKGWVQDDERATETKLAKKKKLLAAKDQVCAEDDEDKDNIVTDAVSF